MRKKAKKFDRLEAVCAELAEYNRKHGTRYSYGEYSALVRLGKIRPKRGPEWYGGKNERKRNKKSV